MHFLLLFSVFCRMGGCGLVSSDGTFVFEGEKNFVSYYAYTNADNSDMMIGQETVWRRAYERKRKR